MTTPSRLPYDRGETGERIRELRSSLNISQAELGFRAGVTQSALSNYENGRRDIPLPVLVSIAAALAVRPVDLVPGLYQLAPLELASIYA